MYSNCTVTNALMLLETAYISTVSTGSELYSASAFLKRDHKSTHIVGISCCLIKRIHKPLIVCSLTRCLAHKTPTFICQKLQACTQDPQTSLAHQCGNIYKYISHKEKGPASHVKAFFFSFFS